MGSTAEPLTKGNVPTWSGNNRNKIIDDLLAVLNQHGLTSQQSQDLLERLGRIIEMGQRLAKGTTH